jgi:uncharacterized protein (TIGR02569 family)
LLSAPPGHVLAAFGASGSPTRLMGGEGRAWLVADTVLKPCDRPAEWNWLAEHLPSVQQEGFRLAPAIRTHDGRWVVDGWCAQRAVVGSHPVVGRWLDVLSACERFHRQVRHLPEPPFLRDRTDPWSAGDRAAWEDARSPDDPMILRLAETRRRVSLRPQFIHGDVTENVLFAEGHEPAIIDIAPYWRPAGFASAVVVADAICWRAADARELLAAVAHIAEFPQLFVRALIYRMTTTVEVSKGTPDLRGYASAVDLALRLANDE